MRLFASPDIIVIKRWEPPKVTEGGIALPENVSRTANSDKIGEVTEVGKGIHLVEIGDKIAWSPYNAVAVDFGAKTGTLFFIKEENVLAIIKETE